MKNWKLSVLTNFTLSGTCQEIRSVIRPRRRQEPRGCDKTAPPGNHLRCGRGRRGSLCPSSQASLPRTCYRVYQQATQAR